MATIAFIDTEIAEQSGKILDIGGIRDDESKIHTQLASVFFKFISNVEFICGHNILKHDIKYLEPLITQAGLHSYQVIDTLYLSPLLFPSKPYHALLKDDKLQYDEANNPLNDAIKAKDLFYDEVEIFKQTDSQLQRIYFSLLHNDKRFEAFFKFISYSSNVTNREFLISEYFKNEICNRADLQQLIQNHPVELSYCLSLIKAENRYSIIPPWVLKNFPDVERIMFLLRSNPCITGCSYCEQALDAHIGLKKFFGHDKYRLFDGETLQENAVKAAVHNKSFLAVFPTGGGKSITFQVPALMSGENTKGLTVVISPLQSLMKDQVDNLEKAGITNAVTINGLLDPIERAKSFERVEDGSAHILYISPESLRSKNIECLLLGRKVTRFVIDEAHCLSSWGQDFRVDYLYIGDFIQSLQGKKGLSYPIPVSCFTATAKQKVIEDICNYFHQKLGLHLDLFTTSTSRTNLHYKVIPKSDEEEKYLTARNLIIDKNCPTIIYVSRTKKARQVAERLVKDGLNARAFHGKLDSREKTANQNAFLSGEVDVMVATSAFGMGVDKKDVGLVIHYDISDSLENYVQEAGRAGRDENIMADCYVLFDEEDLSKHFIMLNQTKLSVKEIQQVWRAIKDLTKFRATVSNSALEIARKAGWDDTVAEIETRVTTAIAALEDAGYLQRKQNSPRIFANSILAKTAQDAIDKINASERFSEPQKLKAIRITKKLFSSKSRKHLSDEEAESRVDYISDHLGIVKEDVITIINLLRDEQILADAKDLTAFIKNGESQNKSLSIVENLSKIERKLIPLFAETPRTFSIKELNEIIDNLGQVDVSINKIKTIINFWSIKNWIRRQKAQNSKDHFQAISLYSQDDLIKKAEKRHQLARFITTLLYQKVDVAPTGVNSSSESLVEFSILELKAAYLQSNELYKFDIDNDDVEYALFYLSKIEAIKIEGGFLVVYNRLTVQRLELDNKRQYRAEDYQKLKQFYQNKIQQIHIVGEYAKKMIANYKDALQFVEDYFQLNYRSFLNRYFKGSREDEIKLNLTPAKFQKLFGELSPTQLSIIKDSASKHIVVAAGPGSGKTKVLVHKLASLMVMEDVKHEQLLMLTFSRASATEFKKRLLGLIYNAAKYIEIKTFHSYCFDLLGRVETIASADTIVKTAVEKIKNGEVERNRITKTVLVIDEAQDMDENEFNLVTALMAENDELRVIAVGDDDQNIYGFRGANSKYLNQLINQYGATKYELVENYRSKRNIVDFANQFVQNIQYRLKTVPGMANQSGIGQIKLTQYSGDNLILAMVSDILSTPLKGNTCVLVKTNEDALQITGSLLKEGMPAKLIQANDVFNLRDLAEIRYFYKLINPDGQTKVMTKEALDEAIIKLNRKYYNSGNLETCQNLIKDFIISTPDTKYLSDFESFVSESKLQDFFTTKSDTVFVSTIHKAKGKEFDNIFIMLNNKQAINDDEKRQIYVAITRAKNSLSIHINNKLFQNIDVDGMQLIHNNKIYGRPAELTIELTHKEIWLDYFYHTQGQVSRLMAGDPLIVDHDECLNNNKQPVLKFSRLFVSKLEKLASEGYHIASAKVNFVVCWTKEDTNFEISVVLPEVTLKCLQQSL